MINLRKPTLAALPGPAAGAGLAIALACDMRIAAESAFVTTGYARIGLSGDYGIAWLLTRAVGNARARELLFLSDRIDAIRATNIGLVNEVVADEVLQDKARELALRLANGPRLALAKMKDNLDDATQIDYRTALDREAERLIETAGHSDHTQALQAFVEKRAARFEKG